MSSQRLEIVCPGGTPAALRAAVEAGADCVYVGFRNETNARNFPGLNFSADELNESVAFAHDKGVKVLVAINTFARAGDTGLWFKAVDDAAGAGADAIIAADIAVLDYAYRTHPELRRHLSVQASAASADALQFYIEAFKISRAVLPRVLTLPQVASITKSCGIETEVFAFGGMCVMADGRCSLSSYIACQSPNKNGVCSPPSAVRYDTGNSGVMTSRLAGYTINRFAPGEAAGYPTLCKGRFEANGAARYLFEEPVSLDALTVLPELMKAGVTAIKIEGRQRGRAYIRQVISEIRRLTDAAAAGERLDTSALSSLSEGGKSSAGVLNRSWR